MNRTSPRSESLSLPLIIVTVRFSVIVGKRESWQIGKGKTEEEYRADLFNEDRLSLHHYLFENVTLPSLEAQVPALSEDRFRLYAITSTELPRHHAAALNRLLSNYAWARIKAVPPTARSVPHGECVEEFLSDLGQGQGAYASVRLDDDDALAADFMQRLTDFVVSENVGRAVSLARGYAGVFDAGQRMFTSILDARLPMIGLGLAYIGAYSDGAPLGTPTSVYGLGNHVAVDTKVPVILDSRYPAFLRTSHQASDIRIKTGSRVPEGEAADQAEFRRRFPSLRNLVS